MTANGSVTQADIQALSEKLTAFSKTLTPGELRAFEALVQASAEEDDVEGHGFTDLFSAFNPFLFWNSVFTGAVGTTVTEGAEEEEVQT